MESLYKLAVMVSALDNFTGPVQKMAKSFSNFDNAINKSKGIIDFGNKMAVSGILVQGAADKSVRAIGEIVKPVMEVGRSLGELKSLGIRDLTSIQQAAMDFSNQWAGTTEPAFISAAYDIKSGISSLSDSAVGDFTRMAALTGKATKASTAEMTSLFATGYGIYKDLYAGMSDEQFGQMFSAGIAGSVQAFKTTGSGMAQALTTLGAAAASAQRPFEEQLAVLGMLQATMPGGEAGTKYKAFIQSAARAGESLGLGFVDSNNQLLSMTDILGKLRGKYGDTLDAMEKQQIQKAFGTEEAVALIDLLYPKMGQLKTNMDQLGQATLQGTAFTEGMARAMNDDLGSGFELMGQNITIFKRSLGQELEPLLKAFLPDIRAIVTGFQGFAKVHPTLVRSALLIGVIAAAAFSILAPLLMIGASLTLLGGYFAWSFGQMGKGITTFISIFKGGFKYLIDGFKIIRPLVLNAGRALLTFGQAAISTARTALPGLISSVWSFTAALLANPITWIVIGIIALIAVIILLWKNWDKVTAALGKGWDYVKTKFAGAKQWFSDTFQSLIDTGKRYGPMVLAVVFPFVGIPLLIAQNWDTIKQLIPKKISEIIQAIKNKATEFMASGRALIQSFVDGIRSLIDNPANVVREGLAKLRNLLPFSDAKEGPLSTLTYSGMALINTFAAGIQMRSPYLQAVAASAFGGIAMADGIGSWGSSPLGRTPTFGFKELIKESSHDRERTFTRDRRPIVVVVGDQGRKQADFQSHIDQALRYLEMSGD